MHTNGREWGMVKLASAMALLCAVAGAHEHWLNAECFYPEAGQTVTVHLCSGHYFPKSSFALQDKVLAGVDWQRSDGVTVPFHTVVGAAQRSGTFGATDEGVHILSFTLKRPRAQAPSYEGKVILIVGDSGDSTNRYTSGVGLELVPEQPVSALRKGDKVGIALWMDGRRVKGSISASAAGGKTSLLTTGIDQAATLTLRKAGRYLVTSTHEDRGASLVFEVKGSEGGSQKSEVSK